MRIRERILGRLPKALSEELSLDIPETLNFRRIPRKRSWKISKSSGRDSRDGTPGELPEEASGFPE